MVHFWADFAEECKNISEVLTELSKVNYKWNRKKIMLLYVCYLEQKRSFVGLNLTPTDCFVFRPLCLLTCWAHIAPRSTCFTFLYFPHCLATISVSIHQPSPYPYPYVFVFASGSVCFLPFGVIHPKQWNSYSRRWRTRVSSRLRRRSWPRSAWSTRSSLFPPSFFSGPARLWIGKKREQINKHCQNILFLQNIEALTFVL